MFKEKKTEIIIFAQKVLRARNYDDEANFYLLSLFEKLNYLLYGKLKKKIFHF